MVEQTVIKLAIRPGIHNVQQLGAG